MFDFLIKISSIFIRTVDTPGRSLVELFKLMHDLAGVVSLLDSCGASNNIRLSFCDYYRIFTLSLTVSCLLIFNLPLWDCLRLFLLILVVGLLWENGLGRNNLLTMKAFSLLFPR
jgi:hypothetical protein